MNKSNIIKTLVLIVFTTTLSSFEAVASIFKTGMGVGIFAVLAILVVIVFIFMKLGKNKSVNTE
jgi:hypothetical protein